MTDPPVTLSRLTQPGLPLQRRIALYIEARAEPEIGRFAIASIGVKRLIALSA